MEETTLRFLMDDGAIASTFLPALTPEQYAELHALVPRYRTTDGLLAALEAFAAKHGLELLIGAP